MSQDARSAPVSDESESHRICSAQFFFLTVLLPYSVSRRDTYLVAVVSLAVDEGNDRFVETFGLFGVDGVPARD